MKPIISVIICTHNRATDLARTLTSMEQVRWPAGFDVEWVVVDNASSDETPEVVRSFARRCLSVRPLQEARKGKAIALNTALGHARGEVLAFTDDDVRPDPDWLEMLVEPLTNDRADAVGGRIDLDARLLRPWLEPWHLAWLAVCVQPLAETFELIGANMGIRRKVLERVPGFDPDLGPGAAGLGEDSLFSQQLRRAGFRIGFAPAARVVHDPGLARLTRRSWLRMGESHGRKDAFVLHHWLHGRIFAPRLRRAWLRTKLRLRRTREPQGPMDREGASRWEVSYVGEIAKCTAYLAHRGIPAYYRGQGLRREETRSA